VPRPGELPNAAVSYALGAGAAGNVGRSRTFSQEGGAALATNPVAADDGAEAEDLEAARQRAADALALRDRTVTADDARELAESTPGVAITRAHVTPGLHPCFPCDAVQGALAVTVVPFADRTAEPAAWTVAPQPDAGAVEAVRQRLEGARLLGQEVFVLAPAYRRVTVDVTVSAPADAGDAGERIVAALRSYLDPLVGGSEHEGWPFGGPVRPSALTGVVQEEAGPEATVTRLTVALDDAAPSDCGDLAIGERELVHLGSATVRWVAVAPPGGGLQ
jgi:predicted phage baseplate assembly protein